MIDYKFLDCCGIQEVLVNAEPKYVFEYEKSAWELATEVDGEAVKLYYTSRVHLTFAEENDMECIGYGVIDKDGELI